MFRVSKLGMEELQNELSAGLENVAEKALDIARALAPVEEIRDPAYTRDTLHVVLTHSHDWPKAAVFVSTASGDGFFVHEGTIDTPPHPFLAQTLDELAARIPTLMRSGTMGVRGFRSQAFGRINRAFPEFGITRTTTE